MTIRYIAHIQPRLDHTLPCVLHDLDAHLNAVAKLAQQFASTFNLDSSTWAYLSGLWHDLGKYSPDFQTYLYSASTAHGEEPKSRVNHSSAGALHARQLLGDTTGKLLGYLIAGHHCGLPDWHQELDQRLDLSCPQNQRLYQAAVHAETPCSILEPPNILQQLPFPEIANPKVHKLAPSLWLRMLFSCLIDADFLDTEAFMNPARPLARQQFPKLTALTPQLTRYLQTLQTQSLPTAVNQLRQSILKACLEKGATSPGIYTLTVPTGGGKTLTGLSWALQHAHIRRKARIIYVLPYTSILEQTADLFRAIFGSANVIEHHSNLDPKQESVQSRLACENWDAPLILTTNVQFFESLFANRPSRCRKLHRITNSVVILDEIQQIPPAFKAPIEAALILLSEQYGTTILLSTATQPVLNLPIQAELASDPAGLYQQLQRVRINLPSQWNLPLPWQTLAQTLCQYPRILCIVNSRSDAEQLFAAMPSSGTYHLSACMCPAHRSEVLNAIKAQIRQATTQPIRVISTSLIEAGVDIDFPVVFRALAGLDSIIQAAGRCNREGLQSQGQVYVFIPESPIPIGYQRKAAQVTRLLLHTESELKLTPALMNHYFWQLYGSLNSEDPHGILKLLSSQDGKPHFAFRTAAHRFKLLGAQDEVPILIPWNEEAQVLLRQVNEIGPTRGRLRSLQRFVVTLPIRQAQSLQQEEAVQEIQPGVLQLIDMTCYHEKTGLSVSTKRNKTV